ncbi:L,D-transpeptidase family protein [Taklimakanibacter deserti]|uniref:L,D-transpeptidase family protein n=1 Tax=Taklimakanibacter deserti TaxID=2267839 RepID=UPI0013C4A270
MVEERPEQPLVYQPEKFEILRVGALPESAPDEPLAAAIYGELKGKKSAIRVTAGEREAIVDFYRQNGFRPLWVSKQGLGERGRSVLRLFRTATEDGMSPEDYLPQTLALFDDDLALINEDMGLLARLDLDLSARALRYARHASGGRIIPNKLTKYYDITPEPVDLAAAMRAFLRSPDPNAYLRALQPSHPAYAVFKKTLASLRELESDVKSELIRPGKPIELGEDDPRVPLLRQQLAVLGYDKTDVLPGEETILDDALSERLTAFQTDAGVNPTGVLDAATMVALNSRTGSPGIARLVYNMERLRWLPKTLGERHVFVNQAAYSLKVVEDGREIWRTKVIVGKPNSQTVAFSDSLERIVFNPSWGVPPSIMKNEMIPKLRRDPGYLDRLGYRVLTPGSKRIVRSRSVSWGKYANGKVPYLILQPPGDDNALGELKFLFPNAHDIYMHDTPTRDLFAKPVRAFSHGCVRVENPRQFAELLLGVDATDIAARIDSGVSKETPVTRETSVHLTYFTAWPADDGRLLVYDDIYGRDERMARAFTTVAVAAR